MKAKRVLLTGVGLLAAFVLWTILIMSVDVQNVGQQGTAVGFAAFNTWFHRLIGVHMRLYVITDWLGLVPICFRTYSADTPQELVQGRSRYDYFGYLLYYCHRGLSNL